MADTDFNIGLVAELDGDESKKQINSDIKNIQKQLDKLKLTAEIDSKQLDDLKGKLDNLSICLSDVSISKSTLNGLVADINNALKGIQINNINIGGGGKVSIGNAEAASKAVQSAADRISSPKIDVGFNVSKGSSDAFHKAVNDEISKIQQEKNKLTSVKYTTNTDYREVLDYSGNPTGQYEQIEKLTGAVFRYNTAAGEAITKTMKWAQIDTTFDAKGNEIPVMGWVQGLTTYNKSVDESIQKTNGFADKVSAAANKAENALNSIKSKLNDKGENKTLANLTDAQKDTNGLTAAISKVENAITGLKNSSQSTFTDANNQVTTAISELNSLIATIKNAEYAATSLRTKDVFTVKIDESNKLDSFIEKMKQSGHYTSELESKASILKSELNGVFDTASLTSYLNGLSNLKSEFEKVDTAAKTAEKQTKLDTNIDSERTQLRMYVKDLQNANVYSGEVQTKIEAMFASLRKVNTQSDLTTWRAALKGVKAETDSVLKSTTSFVSETTRMSKADAMQKWLDNNTKAAQKYGAEIQDLINQLKDLGIQMTKAQYDKVTSSFNTTKSNARVDNLLGFSAWDKFKNAVSKFGGWSLATGSLMTAVNKTKEAVTEFKNLDDILTEISKTSDLTTSELEKLGSTAFSTASEYGKTAPDYLSGVMEMSRSGFYGKQGEAMAKQSLLAQAAGDMTADLANKYVIATNAAYKLNGEEEKLNAVIDGQNMVSNRNSVAMQDMADAMTEAGTVASSYRVSIEDLSAMIGTMEAVTKSGGTEVGNSIKSILINLQNVTSNKIVKVLDKANASMTEMVNGTEKLRNPIEILRDLSETFNKLDEDDPLRAEILTSVGGKYQATKLAALLQNMDMFDKMLKDYGEGSGSAMVEAEKSAHNLTGELNSLGNTWKDVVNDFINADDLTALVRNLNGVLSAINQITDVLKKGTILSALAGIFGAKGMGLTKVYGPISMRLCNNAI